MRKDCATAGRIERLEIPDRLRLLERAERKRLSGNVQVRARRGRHDEEHARIGSALVELTGGMEIPRSVAEHRRHPRAIAHRPAQRLQLTREVGVEAGKVRQQSEIIAGPQGGQEAQGISIAAVLARRLTDR
jgi:hypothetical protein